MSNELEFSAVSSIRAIEPRHAFSAEPPQMQPESHSTSRQDDIPYNSLDQGDARSARFEGTRIANALEFAFFSAVEHPTQPEIPVPRSSAGLKLAFPRSELHSLPHSRNRAPRSQHAQQEVCQKSAAESADSKDRRQFPRRDSGCSVKVYLLSEGELIGDARRKDWLLHSSRLSAGLLDISMSGIALALPESVPEQSRLLLRLKNRNFDRQLDTVAEVMRCELDADGEWRTVCRFEHNLSFEQVHDFGRHLFQSALV